MNFEHIPDQEKQPLGKKEIIEHFRETYTQPDDTQELIPESVKKMQPRFIVRDVHERIKELQESFPTLQDATPAEIGLFAEKEAWRIREERYTFDEKTQLPNKNFVKKNLREIIEAELVDENKSNYDHVCHMAIDLNGLKAVNDLSGHAAGDSYLNRIAEWLWSSASLNELKKESAKVSIARTGGDEFGVTIVGNPDDSWDEDRWREIRLNLQFEIESLDVSDLIVPKKIKEVVPEAPENIQFRASAGIGFSTLEKTLINRPKNNKNTITEDDEAIRISENLMGSMLDESDSTMYTHKDIYKKHRGSPEGDAEDNALSALILRTDEARELTNRIKALESENEQLRNA